MTLEEHIEALKATVLVAREVAPAGEEGTKFDLDDYVVLLGDTNFFTGLSNYNIWALYAVAKTRKIVQGQGKNFSFTSSGRYSKSIIRCLNNAGGIVVDFYWHINHLMN